MSRLALRVMACNSSFELCLKEILDTERLLTILAQFLRYLLVQVPETYARTPQLRAAQALAEQNTITPAGPHTKVTRF